MIQFNLLPDVKLQYIRARRLKRTAILISSTVAAASLFFLVLMFVAVSVFQRNYLRALSSDITKYGEQLKNVQDLDKILTVQNQLNSLPALYDQSPKTSRLFGYIQQITPNSATISELTVNFTDNKLSIKGTAVSLEIVNKFTDTLKFTTYKDASETQVNAFKDVVLTDFSRVENNTNYQIDMGFDPYIFDAKSSISTLTVPVGLITTRSQTESPNQLFQTSTDGAGQ